MDAIAILSAIVQAGNGSEKVLRMTRGWDRSIALNIGSSSVGIVVVEGRARIVEPAPSDSSITFHLSADTLNKLSTGQLTPLTGKMKGLIHSSGSTVDVLRFASILSASVNELNARK